MGWMQRTRRRRRRQLNILSPGQMPTKEPALAEEMNLFPEDVSCNEHSSANMEQIVSFSTCSAPEVRGRCPDPELSGVIHRQPDRTKTESPKGGGRPADQ